MRAGINSMRFPWQKTETQKKFPDLAEIEEQIRQRVKSEVSETVRTEVINEVLTEMVLARADAIDGIEVRRASDPGLAAVRELMGNAYSPMQGAPNLNLQNSPHPLYAFNRPYNYVVPQDPNKRPGSLITVETLRTIAENYDVLRACINQIKREVSTVPLRFAPIDPKDDRPSTQRQIKQATAYFSKKGGLGGVNRRRTHFESVIIEDLLVTGAASIFHSKNNAGGAYESLPVDAGTIRPRVDAFGWPGPDEEWYEQWIYGLLIRGFLPEEMSYEGIHPKSTTPYFSSSVEWLVNVVNSALRADDWNRKWLTDGNIPDAMIEVPENWSPEMIMSYATYFDAIMAGDSAARQKAKFVPKGTGKYQPHSRKDQDFAEFELWLLRRTCSVLGVQPASIGYSGEQYKVSQDESMQSTSWFGVGQILDWRKSLYDDILQEKLGLDRIESQNVIAKEERALDRATRNQLQVGTPVKTINEARKEEGLEAVDGGDQLFVPVAVRPMDQALLPPVVPGIAQDNPNSPVKPGNTDDNANPDKGTTNSDPGDGDNKQNRGVGMGHYRTDKTDESLSDYTMQRAKAIGQWERKALNCLARKKSPVCDFSDESLSIEECEVVRGLLEQSTSSIMVRKAINTLKKGVYLVRHATTDMNIEGTARGWLNPSINKLGVKQAKQQAKWFSKQSITEIRSSDLKRAVETSKIIADKTGALYVERNLAYRGWKLGEMRGRDHDDIEPIMDDYAINKPDQNVIGGESFNDFKQRFLGALKPIIARCNDGSVPTMVLVTHSRNMRMAAGWIKNLMPDDLSVDVNTALTLDVPDASVLWVYPTFTGWDYKVIVVISPKLDSNNIRASGIPVNVENGRWQAKREAYERAITA